MSHNRQLLAVLFTDIESSTRLWEQDAGRMGTALARHDALVRTAVAEHHGVVVKMMGDGAHAVFADPRDALLAASQILRALDDPAATAGVALKVRCGVHAGMVERRDDDYYGSVVNRAARIASAAHGGQLLLSRAVELAAVADARRVPEAVASVVGVMEVAGRPVVEALVRYVKDRQLLLILDNCEHVIGACAELAKTLLQASARIRILASSRENLRVTGETTYAVPALTLPGPDAAVDPATLQRCDAVRLFVERAAAVQPAFTITSQNTAAIVDICRRLDGIPLAIELAAARVNVLTVDRIAERLGDRLGLLTRGSRTALPRQRTLRALIDWSFDLLGDAEKTLFARLAVFAGSMTIEAAEAVGADATIAVADVLDLLVALVEKSLVECDASGERYRLLETVREYAQQKLDAAEASAAARTRHLEFFVSLAERARPELWGPAQGEWLQRLDPDRDNFLAALAWCDRVEQGGDRGLRLVYALQLYWLPRGLIELGYRLTVEALARPWAQPRDLNRSGAQYAACQLAYFMGSYESAREHAQECLAIAREFGIRERAASALLLLGYAADALGQRAVAQQHFEESAALARELGDKSRLSFALNALAGHHQESNDLETAEPVFEEALALAREIGDQETIAIGLPNLARLLVEKGAGERVQGLLREGLAIAHAIGSARGIQNVLEVAAGLAVLRRDWRRAARLFGTVEAQQKQMGLKRTPEDNAVLMRRIACAREALGDASFAADEAAGRTLTYEAAVDDARLWLAEPRQAH